MCKGDRVNTNQENENHWPGYVDALTTMTMILIFVMMILAVTLFGVSENVSRSLVERIAAAVGVRVPGDDISTEAFAERVVAHLETRAQVKPPPPTTAYPQPDEITIESKAEPRAYTPNAPVNVDKNDSFLTLSFKPRAAALDENALNEIKSAIDKSNLQNSDLVFVLKAYASTDVGALSDSRRVAFYRAMAVRTRLMGLGIPAQRVQVLVLDQGGADVLDRVQVQVRPPGTLTPPVDGNLRG